MRRGKAGLLNLAEHNTSVNHLTLLNLNSHHTIMSAKQFDLSLHRLNCQDRIVLLDLGTRWRKDLEDTARHR